MFREALRVLRPGGRLAVSDIVASGPMPPALRDDPQALSGCIAGAATAEELRAMILAAGFVDVRIDVRPGSQAPLRDESPGSGAEHFVASASIRAVRPTGQGCCGTTPSSPCC